MAKRPDKGDSTQPLSESQVVAVSEKPPARRPAGGKNDQSIFWRGTVVGADDFAPQPERTSTGKRVVIGVIAAGALGGGAYVLWPKAAATVAKLDAAAMAPAATGSGAGSAPAPDAAVVPAAAIDAAPAPDAAPPADASSPDDAAPPVDAGKPVKRPKFPITKQKKKAQPPIKKKI